MIKDWRTTASGLFAALPQLLPIFGIGIPGDVINGLSAVGLFLIGLFAQDGKLGKVVE